MSDVLHLPDIYKAISKLIKPHFIGPINLPPPRDTLISRYSPIIGLIQLCTTCPANNLEQLMPAVPAFTVISRDIYIYQALFARLIRKLFSVNVIGLFFTLLKLSCPFSIARVFFFLFPFSATRRFNRTFD